jgi:hypothetical protein
MSEKMETVNYTFDVNILSDLHKDAYGFRPRSEEFWNAWDSADDDGKQAIWDGLVVALESSMEEERQFQAKAIVAFEDRISSMMATVKGCQREDAIRYLHDAYDTQGDVGFLEYHLGVPYGYISGKNWG